MAHPDNRDGATILIALKPEVRKITRINITIPEDVLGQIDAFAEARGLSRSGFLVQAAKRAMQPDAA